MGLEKIWTGHKLDGVIPALEAAEAWADQGGWSVGFLGYEAAPAMDPALAAHAHPADGLPLYWWAAFREVQEVEPPSSPEGSAKLEWIPSLSSDEHSTSVDRIHRCIGDGETYQVNFTFPLTAELGDLTEDPEAFFRAVTTAQRSAYGAYLDLGDHVVVSASPELFFRLDDRRVLTRPMKGTARRGRYPTEDAAQRQALHSEKNRAENLMILDMMRNDLGRIAEPGTVQVRRLFHTETYPTVHQLISEVEAQTQASPVELIRALFPCASITGAPKIRTSQIISELEAQPRGLYTGAIGFFGPNRTAQLNVAIRTAVFDRRQRTAAYGTGGGIVWDSNAQEEYEECHTKALILNRSEPVFDLLETLVWRPSSGYFLLDRHIDRLLASADYFSRPANEAKIRRALDDIAEGFRVDSAQGFKAGGPKDQAVRQRVRLKVTAEGEVQVEATSMPRQGRRIWKVALDDRPIDPENVFLFHKTTLRTTYRQARERRPDQDDVLLWNTDGELTESTIGNLVLKIAGRFLTPPIDAALLAGTYRGALLDRGRIQEASLPRSALSEAERAFIINSVRGWIPIEIETYPSERLGTNLRLPSRS